MSTGMSDGGEEMERLSLASRLEEEAGCIREASLLEGEEEVVELKRTREPVNPAESKCDRCCFIPGRIEALLFATPNC
jgi:hypothetical protein